MLAPISRVAVSSKYRWEEEQGEEERALPLTLIEGEELVGRCRFISVGKRNNVGLVISTIDGPKNGLENLLGLFGSLKRK